jgi:hypothetical protein
MRQLGLFNTLVVDGRTQRVQLGPSLEGLWVTIDGWGEDEWDVLLAIVSHPSGASEHDVVRRAHFRACVDRKTVFRIRQRFRAQSDVPPHFAENIIVTKRGTSSYILNPEIKLQMLPGLVGGAGEHGEPRALDSVVGSIKHAGLELFGSSGFRKAIDLLPDDVRRDTVEMSYDPGRWFPVRYISAWIKAMREGPCGLVLGDYKEFLRTMERYRLSPYYDAYFHSGRQHRLTDIQRMWSTCYDSGRVEAIVSPKNDWYEIRLWNHPYTKTPSARWTHGFCWLSLSEALGAKDCELAACEEEELTGALRIRIRGDLF